MTNKIEGSTNPDANLEQLKKQAKRLLKLAKERNPDALSRMERAKVADSIEEGEAQPFQLTDAQLVIARENGSGSWGELKNQIETGVEQVVGEGKTSVQGIDQIWFDCDELEKTEDDLQSAHNRLKEAGVSVGDSPHCIAENWNGSDVWMTFFEDPACNQLAFKCNVPAKK
jgi:hypothetical protein